MIPERRPGIGGAPEWPAGPATPSSLSGILPGSRRRRAATFGTVAAAMLAVGAAAGLRIPWVAQLALAETLIVGFAFMYLRFRRDADHFRALVARRQNTFEGAPVALWEEDFSAVAAWLRTLPGSASAGGLRRLLAASPKDVDHAISLIRVVGVNGMAAQMIDPHEGKVLFGGDLSDAINAEVRAAVIEQLVAMTEGQTNLEVGISGNNRSGQTVEAVLYWKAATDDAGLADYSRVVVAIADISDRMAAQRQLQAVVESKDQLIASISHELRTPLTGVIGYTELLRNPPLALSASEQSEMLGLVANSARDISFIVEDLLAAARRGAGDLNVSCIPVAVGPAIEQVVAQIHVADPSSIEVHAGSARAWVDPARFRQVLRNLLVNGLRYGGEHIRITATSDGPVVRVDVSDDGDGVPLGDEQRIFDPYEQALGKAQQPGSMGLGLTISRDLARLMGGDLTYRRDNGETVFGLTLLAADGGPPAGLSETEAEPGVEGEPALV